MVGALCGVPQLLTLSLLSLQKDLDGGPGPVRYHIAHQGWITARLAYLPSKKQNGKSNLCLPFSKKILLRNKVLHVAQQRTPSYFLIS